MNDLTCFFRLSNDPSECAGLWPSLMPIEGEVDGALENQFLTWCLVPMFKILCTLQSSYSGHVGVGVDVISFEHQRQVALGCYSPVLLLPARWT